MDDRQFWGLIDFSIANSKGDRPKQVELLESKLAELPAEEIKGFGRILGEKSDLCYSDAFRNVARQLIGRLSDDGFEDFQSWLISRGEEKFKQALSDPNSLLTLKVPPGEKAGYYFAFELFRNAPLNAYEEKTGEDWDDV